MALGGGLFLMSEVPLYLWRWVMKHQAARVFLCQCTAAGRWWAEQNVVVILLSSAGPCVGEGWQLRREGGGVSRRHLL